MSQKKFKQAVNSALLDQVESTIREAREEDPLEDKDDEEERIEDRDELESEVSSEVLVQNDFLVVRKNLKKLIRKGHTALNRVVQILEQKEKDKTIKGPSITDLCDLMKTLILSNKELMNSHEVKTRILNPERGNSGNSGGGKITEDNELMVDSTTLSKIVTEIMKSPTKPK